MVASPIWTSVDREITSSDIYLPSEGKFFFHERNVPDSTCSAMIAFTYSDRLTDHLNEEWRRKLHIHKMGLIGVPSLCNFGRPSNLRIGVPVRYIHWKFIAPIVLLFQTSCSHVDYFFQIWIALFFSDSVWVHFEGSLSVVQLFLVYNSDFFIYRANFISLLACNACWRFKCSGHTNPLIVRLSS